MPTPINNYVAVKEFKQPSQKGFVVSQGHKEYELVHESEALKEGTRVLINELKIITRADGVLYLKAEDIIAVYDEPKR